MKPKFYNRQWVMFSMSDKMMKILDNNRGPVIKENYCSAIKSVQFKLNKCI